MISHFYGEFEVLREEDTIIIKNNKRDLLKRIKLSYEEAELGKINIPLSNVCTMACKYCSEAIYNLEQKQFFNQDDGTAIISEYLKYILENNPSLRKIQLTFDYGGEPTIRIECMKSIIEFFKKKCHELHFQSIVQVTTNANCSKNTMRTLCHIADEIIVSIDGYKDLHDKYRVNISKGTTYDEIMANAKMAYSSGKLKQISSVITKDTISDVHQYTNFFIENFPNAQIKISPVIITGAAETNNIERLSLDEWKTFTGLVREIAKNNLTFIDSKPEKRVNKAYQYGCEHMNMCNWFCWLNKKITCCIDREYEAYVIGTFNNGIVKMNYIKMDVYKKNNHIDNILKCNDCLAKYYCSGGCPNFRDEKIDCDRRIRKYVKSLIESYVYISDGEPHLHGEIASQ